MISPLIELQVNFLMISIFFHRRRFSRRTVEQQIIVLHSRSNVVHCFYSLRFYYCFTNEIESIREIDQQRIEIGANSKQRSEQSFVASRSTNNRADCSSHFLSDSKYLDVVLDA